jgi:uncharacterized membrane protein YbhN (UPF0104 family)
MVARSRSWRNVLAAAYPDVPVRWRSVFGAYVAGVGVNAILPARSGDLLRLYLAKQRIEGATYPTLGASLLVETVFDTLVAVSLLAWALSLGVLPGLDVIPSLPAVDWLWLFRYPRLALLVVVALVILAFVFGVWASRHIEAFRRRVAQGFTIMRSPRRYLRSVAAWQAVDWAFRIVSLYFFLRAFGLPADLHNALLAQVAQSLSTILPLTPAGIGTEQALLVYVFNGTASTSAVLSFSVGMKTAIVIFNVTLGFTAIAIMLRTLRWRTAIGSDAQVSSPQRR